MAKPELAGHTTTKTPVAGARRRTATPTVRRLNRAG